MPLHLRMRTVVLYSIPSAVMLSKPRVVVISFVIFTMSMLVRMLMMHFIVRGSWNSSMPYDFLILYTNLMPADQAPWQFSEGFLFSVWLTSEAFSSYFLHMADAQIWSLQRKSGNFQTWTLPVKSNPPNYLSWVWMLPTDRWYNWLKYLKAGSRSLVFPFPRDNLVTSDDLLLSRSRALQAQSMFRGLSVFYFV